MLTEPIPCVQDDVTLLDCLCISTSVLGACRVHLTISHWPAVGHPDGRLHGGNSPRAAGTAAAARRWGSSRGWPPGAPSLPPPCAALSGRIPPPSAARAPCAPLHTCIRAHLPVGHHSLKMSMTTRAPQNIITRDDFLTFFPCSSVSP